MAKKVTLAEALDELRKDHDRRLDQIQEELDSDLMDAKIELAIVNRLLGRAKLYFR